MGYAKTVFVVNPQAASGETGRAWPRIRARARELLGDFEAHLTRGAGDATTLTRERLQEGADRIIGVGGDGTLNEVINGFFDGERPLSGKAVLGFLPNGTGCDFSRTLPIPTGLDSALATICENAIHTIDLGRVCFQDHAGQRRARYFHNIASAGLGGEVVDRVNRTSKAGGPFLSFIWGTLRSLLSYEGKRVRLSLDGGEPEEVAILNVAVANGRYHGGGMLVAPGAAPDDGLFQVTVIGTMTLPLVLWHLPKLYLGGIERIRQVSLRTAVRVTATSEQRVLLDVDGEQPGVLPAEWTILPGALRMILQGPAGGRPIGSGKAPLPPADRLRC